VLVKQGTNEGDYYIAARIPNATVLSSPRGFIRVEGEDFAMACSWSDFSPILKGKSSLSLRVATAYFEDTYSYWNSDGIKGKLLDNNTGEVVYEGIFKNIDCWGELFHDENGNTISARNNWGRTK
jgi:hypothetical protein